MRRRRKEESALAEQRAALLRRRPADLPPKVRVREALVVNDALTLQAGRVFHLHDPLVQEIMEELADPNRFFEVVP